MMTRLIAAGREERTTQFFVAGVVGALLILSTLFTIRSLRTEEEHRRYASIAARGIPLASDASIIVSGNDPIRVTATERVDIDDPAHVRTITIEAPRSAFDSDVEPTRRAPWIEANDGSTLLPIVGPIAGGTPRAASKLKLHLRSLDGVTAPDEVAFKLDAHQGSPKAP